MDARCLAPFHTPPPPLQLPPFSCPTLVSGTAAVLPFANAVAAYPPPRGSSITSSRSGRESPTTATSIPTPALTLPAPSGSSPTCWRLLAGAHLRPAGYSMLVRLYRDNGMCGKPVTAAQPLPAPADLAGRPRVVDGVGSGQAYRRRAERADRWRHACEYEWHITISHTGVCRADWVGRARSGA